MNNAIIITNQQGTKKEMNEHLQMITRTSDEYNIRITSAVIERSKDDEALMEETMNLVGDLLCRGDCEAIVVDDTFDFEMTELYSQIKEMADLCNIQIFHYFDDDLYLAERNRRYQYSLAPFEVYEMKVADEERVCCDEYLENILQICKEFQEEMNRMEDSNKLDELMHFTGGLIDMSEFFMDEIRLYHSESEE